jgi:hypothetical protein
MQQAPGGRGLPDAPRTGVEAMSGPDADNQPETTHIGAVDGHYRYDGAGERARKLVDKVHVGEQGPYPDAQNSTGPDDPIVKQSDYVLERDELPNLKSRPATRVAMPSTCAKAALLRKARIT